MDKRAEHLQLMIDTGIVAVIRANSSAQLMDIVKALKDGGVKTLEITMTTPNALAAISEAQARYGKEVVVGVGSVLDPETARAAILAGAEFVVAPTLNVEVIRLCQRYSKVVVPGAFTPTEILTAWEAGADAVKVFPATKLGPEFFKDIMGPLPHIRLTPTGGVDLETSLNSSRPAPLSSVWAALWSTRKWWPKAVGTCWRRRRPSTSRRSKRRAVEDLQCAERARGPSMWAALCQV